MLLIQFLNDKEATYKWITELEDYGICLLTEAPKESGVVGKIGEKVAHLRKTNYK